MSMVNGSLSQRERGFTMLELIVVTGIFIVTLAVSLVSFRGASRNESLRLSGEMLVDLVKDAESRTQTGQVFGADVPKGGYGVRIDLASPRSLLLFADVNANAAYDDGEKVAGGERTFLPDVRVTSSTVNPIDMVFKPPEPTLLLNGSTLPPDVTIVLLHDDTGAQRQITIRQLTRQITNEAL